MKVTGLKCRNCGSKYDIQPVNICEECFGPLEVEYDYEVVKEKVSRGKIEGSEPTLWRYIDFMPVEDRAKVVDLKAGYTPLHRADHLGEKLGLKELYIKNDSVNPTFSFKDRVVSVAVSKAMEFGFETIACASTGNLANSVAAHAAKAKLNGYIFIPSNLSRGKIIPTLAYDPNLVAIDGNYDDVNRLCTEISSYYDWGFVNINLRPYYSEGSKTLGFEVAEQMGWEVPDRYVSPVGSGSLLTKIHKGFKELEITGLVDEVDTRVTAAQSEGCSPVTSAFRSGEPIKPVKPDTIEQSLAIGNPADGFPAVKLMKETGGTAGAASDEDIVEGIKLLASTEGIFTETAGGVVIGSLKNLVESGEIDRDEKIVAYITGNGLKTQDVLAGRLREPPVISPDLDEFNRLLKKEAVVYGKG